MNMDFAECKSNMKKARNVGYVGLFWGGSWQDLGNAK